LPSTIVTHLESPETRETTRRHRLMYFLLLVTTFCWGGNIIAGKEALRGFSPLALAYLRVLGAAVLFGVLFLGWRRRSALPQTRREWFILALTALCGVTLNQICFIGGLARTSAAHTGLLVTLGPVMVLVLSCALRLEVLTVPKFVGMLLSFGGAAILSMGKAGPGNGGYWRGDLLLLAGGLVFAFYTILAKEVINRYDVLTLNTLTFGLGALLMTPLGARAVLNVRWAAVPAEAWGGLAYMVVLGSLVSYLIYTWALRELTAARVAAFAYLQPVITTGLGIWLLAERLTWRLVIGGAVILLGVYLTERERGEEKPLQSTILDNP
jgi:drug/metabolite transporter (DMT)-like permease